MKERRVLFIILALVAGIVASFIKLMDTFFPLSEVVDVVFFGILCGAFGFVRPSLSWRWGVIVSAPSLLLIGITLRQLGINNLGRGTGTGWAVSAVVVPAAACAGAYIGAQIASRRTRSLSTQCL